MVDVDAVVVGARCAGATLAAKLAGAGWRVVLLDRAPASSQVVSTHVIFPDTLLRLERLGALERLRATHHIPLLDYSWRALGHDVNGRFSPVGGFDRASCVRRVVLDQVLVDVAVAAGATVRLGTTVIDLIGAGTDADPVRGVVLDSGERIHAPWVFGADGHSSMVARRLGLGRTGELRGGQSFLFAYWRGLPAADAIRFDVHPSKVLMSTPCEDDVHLLCLVGDRSLIPGKRPEREERYRDGIRHFPATLNSRLLDCAERISPVIAAPEPMMRGFYRTPAGAGWALIGDAGHVKHPATAQGIGDAIEQASFVADAVTTSGSLAGYAAWREDRAAGHYEWSFSMGTIRADDTTHAVFAGLAAAPEAAVQWRDLLTKRHKPQEVLTADRLTRWHAAWAYEDGRRRLTELVSDLTDTELATTVPACPDWSIRDLVAHVVGLAADTALGGGYFAGAADAWRDPELASGRDRWTADQVASRAGHDIHTLLREWDHCGDVLETQLRRGEGFAADAPEWMLSSPAADLGVHLHDIREALGRPGDEDSAVTRMADTLFRRWFAQRLLMTSLPALRLDDGSQPWIAGTGEPSGTLSVSRFERLRVLTGRRSAEQIRRLAWDTDPGPYLAVISPYPLPEPARPVLRTR
jgi:uncharacterized protein (TIGR03083 family)